MARRAAGVATVTAILVVLVSSRSASALAPASTRLLTYLWNYNHWQLRPYVSSVSLSGGHVVVANGKSRLTGATANVHATLHDQQSSAKATRFICQVAAGGVQKLHLRMVSTVQVWSVEGRLVARC
jgi:hypothetical protein